MPIQSISRDVRLSVVLCVQSPRTRYCVDWSLLVKDRVAKIAKLRNHFLFEGLGNFLDLKFFGGFR